MERPPGGAAIARCRRFETRIIAGRTQAVCEARVPPGVNKSFYGVGAGLEKGRGKGAPSYSHAFPRYVGKKNDGDGTARTISPPKEQKIVMNSSNEELLNDRIADRQI